MSGARISSARCVQVVSIEALVIGRWGSCVRTSLIVGGGEGLRPTGGGGDVGLGSGRWKGGEATGCDEEEREFYAHLFKKRCSFLLLVGIPFAVGIVLRPKSNRIDASWWSVTDCAMLSNSALLAMGAVRGLVTAVVSFTHRCAIRQDAPMIYGRRGRSVRM